MAVEPGGALLLDTHIWIWYVEGATRRFARRVEPAVERAATRGTVFVSVMSVWEVAMLASARRLDLAHDVRTWVARSLAGGIALAGLTPDIAIESASLPGLVHGDPVDRMLIATARAMGATLVTLDARILKYASGGHVRVLDATPA